MTRKNTLMVLLQIFALVAASCGGSGEAGDGTTTSTTTTTSASPSDGGTTTNEDTGAELLPLSVAIQPILPTFTIHIAQQEGFFEAEGLDVTVEAIFGNDIITQAVQTDEVQIGSRNYDGIVSAIAEDFSFEVLYPVVMYDAAAADAFIMIDSDLDASDPTVLEGNAISAPIGVPLEASMKWLEENGVDIDAVEVVEMRYGDLATAFETNQIAGAAVVEPFITQLQNAGLAEITGAHLDTVGDRFLIQAAFATSEWIEANPDTVERFVRAMDAATRFVQENLEDLLAEAAAFTELDEEVVASFYPSRYVVATEVTTEELQRPIEFLVERGLLDEAPSVDVVVADVFPVAR